MIRTRSQSHCLSSEERQGQSSSDSEELMFIACQSNDSEEPMCCEGMPELDDVLWEIDELEAFDKHKRFHEDTRIYIEKLKNGSLADKPKRPKVKLPSLHNDGNGASKKNTKNMTLVLRSINCSPAQTSAFNMLIKRIPWNAGSGASSPSFFARNAMFSSLFAMLELGGR